MFQTSSLARTVSKIFLSLTLVLLTFFPITVAAQETFDKNLPVSSQTFYSLPKSFNSADSIQKFLVSKGSVLAKYKFKVSFETDDDLIQPSTFESVPDKYEPRLVMKADMGKEFTAAQLIWKISRTKFSNGCSLSFKEICFDNGSKPSNPGYLIAMIQKESGLIYGQCAQANADTNPNCKQSIKFRLERALGYYCFESPDKSKSCYDANPNWRFFKGFFRQLYYSYRVMKYREQTCLIGGKYAFRRNNETYIVNATITIGGEKVKLLNAITCGMYIYTPHISSQKLVWQIMKSIQAEFSIQNFYNLPENYKPGRLRFFAK